MMKTERSIEETLQEEFFQERAAVLCRATEKLEVGLRRLTVIDSHIAGFCLEERDLNSRSIHDIDLEQLNEEIDAFNKAREEVKLCYYYLIVTREALGLRKHHWIEQCYPIPPKKKKYDHNW
jgi:hypothetical protein